MMQTHRAYNGLHWVYGTSFIYEQGTDTWYFYDPNEEKESMVGKPEPQIGINDKNGTPIYLNDIVRDKFGTGIIQYDNGEYYIKYRDGVSYQSRLTLVVTKTLEVIDNLTEEKL